MKLMIVAMFFLVSCGSIKKTNNIIKKMENYTFSFPAAQVYSAARGHFQTMSDRVTMLGGASNELINGKKNRGATKWFETKKVFGGKSYIEKKHFTVVVTPISKVTSKLKITEVRMNNMSGKWAKIGEFRKGLYEYNTLEVLDPAAAAIIDKEAAK